MGKIPGWKQSPLLFHQSSSPSSEVLEVVSKKSSSAWGPEDVQGKLLLVSLSQCQPSLKKKKKKMLHLLESCLTQLKQQLVQGQQTRLHLLSPSHKLPASSVCVCVCVCALDTGIRSQHLAVSCILRRSAHGSGSPGTSLAAPFPGRDLRAERGMR